MIEREQAELMKRQLRHVVDRETTLLGWEMGVGPTVLLLHAGGEHCGVWEPVASIVIDRFEVRCVAVDQRGHGSSGGLADSLAVFGADAASLIASQPGPVIVVGSSLGGLAAVNALSFPNVAPAVAGLVLVDVVPDPNPARSRRYLESRDVARRNAPLINNVLESAGSQGEILRSAQLPVLLVRATRSVLDDTDVARLADLTPNLTIVTIESGHLVSQDAPEDLACAIGIAIDNWHVARPPRRPGHYSK